MYLISHRGNVYGENTERENHPDYINEALNMSFDVEIDVWVINNTIYLGHDKPQYMIDLDFLKNSKLWCHAKNFNALSLMMKHKDQIHFFVHNTDSHTLTSRGFIWSYTGKELDEHTICVLPEKTKVYSEYDLQTCKGICSDYIINYVSPVTS